jgi:DNA-binding transcriptional regulator LsrR (DeoR family)
MLHMVAKLHYEADMTQVDIARKLGVSTATVSRLLQKARTAGIVRIEVLDLASPEEVTLELVEILGLKRAAVIDKPATGVLGALAAPLGNLLKEEGLGSGSVVGIGWGRAIISSAELREAFMSDPSVSETTDLWNRLDCCIVGIGLPHAINPPEASAATLNEQSLRAVGDVIRHYVDFEGRILTWEGEDRMIAATPAQLRGAGLSIGVAATVEKAAGIVGAARSGMINAVVTDTATAQAILSIVRDR